MVALVVDPRVVSWCKIAPVRVVVQPNLPEVPADEGQVRQALINLVRNAREAMRDDARPDGAKRLEISVHAEAGRVAVRVRDSGPGIAQPDPNASSTHFFDEGAGHRAGAGAGPADRRRSPAGKSR